MFLHTQPRTVDHAGRVRPGSCRFPTNQAPPGPAASARSTRRCNGLSFGPVYEPLVFVNALQSGKTTPWLASSFAWSNGNKTLTFTIRKGVKFSDGSPMSAADVAFTFNLLKKFKALDLNSVWSVLSSVTQQGDNVVMNFKSPAVPYFYYIADQVGIVPMKIWSKLSNPVNFTDKNPIGTGAYTVKCSPQLITYTASKHYYQPGEPHIGTILYPSYTSNDPANLDLATGKAQWGGQFIPSINKFYTSKSPSYHYWFPPVDERVHVHQPEGPGAERRPRAPGHGLRDRPQQGLDRRRVRV